MHVAQCASRPDEATQCSTKSSTAQLVERSSHPSGCQVARCTCQQGLVLLTRTTARGSCNAPSIACAIGVQIKLALCQMLVSADKDANIRSAVRNIEVCMHACMRAPQSRGATAVAGPQGACPARSEHTYRPHSARHTKQRFVKVVSGAHASQRQLCVCTPARFELVCVRAGKPQQQCGRTL